MEIILDHNAVAMVSVCNTPFFKAKIPSIVELEDGTDQLGQMKWALKPYTLKPCTQISAFFVVKSYLW